MKEERKFQIIYIAWVPFVLGVLGYNIEHIPFWEAIYASAALYFVNPVLDNNNVLILLAKLTALLVSATIIVQVVKNVSALLKNKLRILKPGTVVIYTDTEQGTQLAKNISNGIVSHNGPEDSVENAKIHFIAFENDLDNLRFYSMNEERLKGCHVYIQSNQIEPSLLQSYSNTDVRFFNTAELIARYYWDNNELFNNIL